MRVGVLGGGQLGRMLALAGLPLGMRFCFLDPAADACARDVGELVPVPWTDGRALAALALESDVVTYEFENVPEAAAAAVAARGSLRPSAASLAVAQDRLEEKRLFGRLGIATAPFAPAQGEAEVRAALAEVGLPARVKTRRLGYDGKGQARVAGPDDVPAALRAVGDVPLLVEAEVAFRRELSVVAVRAADGEVRAYPAVENHHRDGILRLTLAPAPALDGKLDAAAADAGGRVLAALDHVGVLTLELFETDAGLVANEIAPRVHNSGHWTIEGAATSQFENHLRAVAGLPLGATAARGESAMVNLVGGLPEPAAVLAVPGAHLHRYGKEPRPGRKVGHVTVLAETHTALEGPLDALRGLPGVALP